jgi:hypothetical protein
LNGSGYDPTRLGPEVRDARARISGEIMQTDQLTDNQLRSLVVSALNRDPDASFQRMQAHLRSRQGRTLDSVEIDELRTAYETELANPTGPHRIGASEAIAIEANRPFVLRRTEMAGLAFGLIPLVVHLQTTTPGTVNKATGVAVAGGVYDLAAMLGGFLAVILGFAAARQVGLHSSRRPQHLALVGLILLLGVYQSLLGLGILHQIGLFRAA